MGFRASGLEFTVEGLGFFGLGFRDLKRFVAKGLYFQVSEGIPVITVDFASWALWVWVWGASRFAFNGVFWWDLFV